MSYITLALVALMGFGFHDFFAKLMSARVPAIVIAGVASIVGGICILGFAWLDKTPLTASKLILLPCSLGLLMGIAYATYILALSRGPISVVTPIMALYFMVPSLLGIILLGEQVTFTKVLGIGFASLAIFLLTR
jgi:drug/metabolite transporter (DMT)-like permease